MDEESDQPDRRGTRIVLRLSGMMGLIYMVQGCWWPLLAVHLGDLGLSGRSRGWVFATFALAAIATPLGAGQVADRWMPTQRLLATIYACGAMFLAVVGAGWVVHAGPLFGLFLLYWLITAPGYGLANSLAFRNLKRPAQQFSGVRLWGTVGWMVIGWVVSAVLAWRSGSGVAARGVPEAFWIGAVLSGTFAAYCLTLPNTPPLAKRRGLDLGESVRLVRRPPVAVFLATAFLVCLTVPFMYQVEPAYLRERGLPRAWIPLALTMNQIVEIVALATLPWMHRRVGYRGAMLVGVLAWTVHYGILACDPPLAVVLAAFLLNGVGVACFLITGQVFLDGQAPGHLRASAQALYVVVATGLGSFVGNILAGEIVMRNQGIGASVFLLPALINAVMLAVLAGWFRPAPPITSTEGSGSIGALRPVARRFREAAEPGC